MKTIYLFLTLTFFSLTIQAQEVELDVSYADSGINKLNIFTGNDNQCLLSAVQDDNKVILCGVSVNSSSLVEFPFLSRYLEDGSLDLSFNNTGLLMDSNYLYATPFSMTLQDDGKIVIAGEKYYPNNPASGLSGFVARYNSDGSIDSTFNNSGIVEVKANSGLYFGRTVTTFNNDIFLAGFSYLNNVDYDFFCAKIKPTGIIDSTFGMNGIADLDLGGNDICRGISIQSDGKIILSGFEDDNFSSIVSRLNVDGSSDLSFNNNFNSNNKHPYGAIYQTIIDEDDNFYGIGFSYDTIVDKVVSYIIKGDDNGALNSNFGIDGEFFYHIDQEDTYGIYGALHSNGRIVVVGNSGDAVNFQMKLFALGLQSDGTIDTSFADHGIYEGEIDTNYDLFNAVHLSPSNKIIATGYYEIGNQLYAPVIAQFKIEEIASGLSNIDQNVLVKIYPNPILDGHVNISNPLADDLSFNIVSSLGQVLIKTSKIAGYEEVQYSIDFAAGLYFINLYENGDLLQSAKLIVK